MPEFFSSSGLVSSQLGFRETSGPITCACGRCSEPEIFSALQLAQKADVADEAKQHNQFGPPKFA